MSQSCDFSSSWRELLTVTIPIHADVALGDQVMLIHINPIGVPY